MQFIYRFLISLYIGLFVLFLPFPEELSTNLHYFLAGIIALFVNFILALVSISVEDSVKKEQS